MYIERSNNLEKIELLAPAGDLEKLKMAIMYGADAVYLGGENFGLRKASKNFSIEDIEEGLKFAHERDKKLYITLNIVPHEEDMIGLEEYLLELDKIGVDAVIVADPGMFTVVRRTLPDMDIHISTQASVTNYETMMFWYDLGVKRIVLARELSLEEIEKISERLPEDLEIEAFVHGAMCMSYSGRCLISNYMTGRDANRGDCMHACRLKYNLVEETRPGQYFPVYEDDDGTFIMNSKDLCMIDHIPELVKSGIKSFKIEGRVKSSYYVATIIRAYRMAIDEYYRTKDNYEFDMKYRDEIEKTSFRAFTTGFYFGKPTNEGQVYETSSYIRKYDFVGIVRDYDEKTGIATVEQRNRIFVGDKIEVFGPDKDHFEQVIEEMWDDKGKEIDVAPHAQQEIRIKMKQAVNKMDMLRKERED